MTTRPGGRGAAAVLLDIEGTTTPIAFVHEVLFPFARARLLDHLRATWDAGATREAIGLLAAEHQADVEAGREPPAWQHAGAGDSGTEPGAAAAYAAWLMDRDRKSQGLKLLQGHIWETGYRVGTLHGEVYPDVPPAIRRWHAAGVAVAIYSSGSEQAQRRLFESTPQGDLTPLLTAYFDTRVGPKTDAASYARIATALGIEPAGMLFVSDVAAELTAARQAGLQAVLSIRPGNPAQPETGFRAIRSFDEL